MNYCEIQYSYVRRHVSIALVSFLLLVCTSCGVYTFSGASIPTEMKTISVLFFENQAPIVVPSLSQNFTEALKNRIRTQTPLMIKNNPSDAVIEGKITGYSIQPIAIQSNEKAALNRLTISVWVHYTNNLDSKLSFEQSFTRYADFSTENQTLEQQELTLITNIGALLTEDIFNRAFTNW